MLLSSQLGLGGIGTFGDVSELGCEVLGQLPTQNPDLWILAKLQNLRQHEPLQISYVLGPFTPVGAYRERGWPYRLDFYPNNIPAETLNDNLMALPFALPEVGEKITKLLRVKGDITCHVRKTVPPAPGGECKLFLLTLRDINADYAATMLSQAGISGTTRRAGVADSNAAIRAGRANPRQYVGLPQVAK
jgi:hypothetical protein